MKDLKVGLQLYSIREEMAKDMDAALKAVKEMGYDYVEFAGAFLKSAGEVKAILDKYDLNSVSIHWGSQMFEEDAEAAIKALKTIGIKYSAIPHYSRDEFMNNWDGTIEKFTKLGKLLSENGIKLLYHNHDFEFNKIDGEYIIDKMYSSIPEEYFAPQFDTCWVHYAGENPAKYLEKYSGRIDVVHLKDFVCEKLGAGPVYELIDSKESTPKNSREENGFKFMPVGSGIQNWEEILTAAYDNGAKYVIVEQDEPSCGTPLEDAAKSRQYLKNTFGI